MGIEEILLNIIISQSPATTALVTIILWKIRNIEKATKTLNHNSTQITKALLNKGILTPEDIKDVNLA